MFEKKKVGLALGGGGARGMAHIGVLKVLEKNNIPIDMIAGTSIGAIIGALYSSEPNSKKLKKDALEEDWNKLFDYTLSRYGLIKGKKIEDYLDSKLNGMKFNDLKIPLYITSFDLVKSQEVIFSHGDVAKAVRASIGIPGIFMPTENGGKTLIDGGVVDPIPIDILKKKGADIIIAVDVGNFPEKPPIEGKAVRRKGNRKMPNILRVIQRSSFMMGHEIRKLELAEGNADMVISPNVSKIGLLDFKKTKKAIRRGERATKKSLKELRKLTGPHPLKDFLEGLKGLKEDIAAEVEIKK